MLEKDAVNPVVSTRSAEFVQLHVASPRVSVVIPTHNRGGMLIEAVQSVLAQTYPHLQIIVIDDGSTDQTAELVKPYLDRITYRRQLNGGVAAARNHGLRLAQGEWICFLDSDDKWKPEKLARQLAYAAQHPECGLIATEIEGFNEHGMVPGRAKSSMYKIRNGYVLEKLLFSNWIQTSTVMVRHACLEKVGAFDEDVGQFGEDWLLWMRIAAEYPVHFLPEPLVLYRVHEESLMSHRPEQQYQSLMAILERLSTWPQFRGKQNLLDSAMYRIAVYRAKSNLQAGRYALAIEKLRYACRLRSFPWFAAGLLLRAEIGNRLHAHKPTGVAA